MLRWRQEKIPVEIADYQFPSGLQAVSYSIARLFLRAVPRWGCGRRGSPVFKVTRPWSSFRRPPYAEYIPQGYPLLYHSKRYCQAKNKKTPAFAGLLANFAYFALNSCIRDYSLPRIPGASYFEMDMTSGLARVFCGGVAGIADCGNKLSL